jgi:hypothetical protein
LLIGDITRWRACRILVDLLDLPFETVYFESMVNGQLIPVGAGSPIPLLRAVVTLGRRESCDVCLAFPNVSGLHCELVFEAGRWLLRDWNSTNGVKVNGIRVEGMTVLDPKDIITIAKRHYVIDYVPGDDIPPAGVKAPLQPLGPPKQATLSLNEPAADRVE